MDNEFSSIEQKVEKVVAFCHALREENRVLRGRIAGLESEKLALAEKIDTTRERLEALMTRLPEQ
jgi:cell division protein ZapB